MSLRRGLIRVLRRGLIRVLRRGLIKVLRQGLIKVLRQGLIKVLRAVQGPQGGTGASGRYMAGSTVGSTLLVVPW